MRRVPVWGCGGFRTLGLLLLWFAVHLTPDFALGRAAAGRRCCHARTNVHTAAPRTGLSAPPHILLVCLSASPFLPAVSQSATSCAATRHIQPLVPGPHLLCPHKTAHACGSPSLMCCKTILQWMCCVLCAGKGAAKHAEPLVLSAQSQSLDLVSPAGRYRLDMSHPASHRVVTRLRELQRKLEAAVQAGKVVGVALALTEVALNAKPLRADKLEGLSQLGQASFELKFRRGLKSRIAGVVPDSHCAPHRCHS